MRVVVQRVTHAQIVIDGEPPLTMRGGFVALTGFRPGDGEREVDALATKLCGLRVFSDGNGQMNLALADVGGACLVVPNFTLYADCKKGRRPSFVKAAAPGDAEPLFRRFVEQVRATGLETLSGRFGANMQITLENDGPVTLILDSDELL